MTIRAGISNSGRYYGCKCDFAREPLRQKATTVGPNREEPHSHRAVRHVQPRAAREHISNKALADAHEPVQGGSFPEVAGP